MKYFRVDVLAATPNPQQVIWAAMHQDYAEEYVWNGRDRWPDEEQSGELIVKHLLSGDRGHYGPLEHPQITVNVGYFPHSMMQQLRTHRVGVSFDVQSFRYTGQRVVDVVEGKLDIEEVFYMRPVGNYTNRQGKRYFYSEEQRQDDLQWCLDACKHYKKRIDEGLSEEHARSIIPFDARQHFVLSCNVRSLLHLLDLRWKKDAQLEAQKFCELIWVHFEEWTPAIAKWYSDNRAHKAKLAP
ncbi:FAD-dependent thymidylate synthase [Cyanobacteria bacterium FACHB-472]|nr:FAD-dependent thymidylate synthase [Cyanobacteria bacterium FACHB-472]